jgi:hypothetical protein
VPRLDFDPTFSSNFATRQDLNLGIDKVFNFNSEFNRVPASSNSAGSGVWSFGFSVGGQRRFRDPAPQSYALLFNPSASYVISEQWNASLALPMTRRWFDTFAGIGQRDLTIEPTGIIEYVIPSRWLGGADSRQPRCRFLCWRRAKLVEHIGSCLYPMAGRSGPQDRMALLNKGAATMYQKGQAVLFSLFIAGCVWIKGASAVRAQLADGVWTVRGDRIPAPADATSGLSA